MKEDTIKLMESGGVKFQKLGEKANVMFLWTACKKFTKDESESDSVNQGVDLPIPKEPKVDLDAQWVHKHGLFPPEDWLLTLILQGKLWRSFNGETMRIDASLVEMFRPM